MPQIGDDAVGGNCVDKTQYMDRATPMRKHLDCANVCVEVVVEDEILGSILWLNCKRGF